jgi:hypothetical protein
MMTKPASMTATSEMVILSTVRYTLRGPNKTAATAAKVRAVQTQGWPGPVGPTVTALTAPAQVRAQPGSSQPSTLRPMKSGTQPQSSRAKPLYTLSPVARV